MDLIVNNHSSIAVHPGFILKELLKENEMTQLELALRTGVSAKHISTIVNGIKRITYCFAVRLEFVFPKSAKEWLSLQAAYDVAIEKENRKNSISQYEFYIYKMLGSLIKRLIEYGTILGYDFRIDNLIELMSFYRINDIHQIPKIKIVRHIQYPKALNVNTNQYLLLGWFCLARNLVSSRYAYLKYMPILEEEELVYRNKLRLEQKLNWTIAKEIDLDFRKKRILHVFKKIQMNKNKLKDITSFKQYIERFGVLLEVVPNMNGIGVKGVLEIRKRVICIYIVEYEQNDKKGSQEENLFEFLYLLAIAMDWYKKDVYWDFVLSDQFPRKKALFIAKNQYLRIRNQEYNFSYPKSFLRS